MSSVKMAFLISSFDALNRDRVMAILLARFTSRSETCLLLPVLLSPPAIVRRADVSHIVMIKVMASPSPENAQQFCKTHRTEHRARRWGYGLERKVRVWALGFTKVLLGCCRLGLRVFEEKGHEL